MDPTAPTLTEACMPPNASRQTPSFVRRESSRRRCRRHHHHPHAVDRGGCTSTTASVHTTVCARRRSAVELRCPSRRPRRVHTKPSSCFPRWQRQRRRRRDYSGCFRVHRVVDWDGCRCSSSSSTAARATPSFVAHYDCSGRSHSPSNYCCYG